MRSCEGSASQKISSGKKKKNEIKGGEMEEQNFPENWTVHNLITCFTTHFENCLQYLCSGKHTNSTRLAALRKRLHLKVDRLISFPCGPEPVMGNTWTYRWLARVQVFTLSETPSPGGGGGEIYSSRPPWRCSYLSSQKPGLLISDDILKMQLVCISETFSLLYHAFQKNQKKQKKNSPPLLIHLDLQHFGDISSLIV